MKNIRRKIIYVDDVQYSLLSVKDRLKKHCDIYPAESVEKLFEIIGRVNPELVLLDINMPGADGFEAIRRLKASDAYAGIPVIFLTGNTDRASAAKAIRLGASDFIRKPFSDEDLIESIEYLLDPVKQQAIKPVILAIDDNPSILKAVNHLLKDSYTVYTLPEPEKLKTLLTVIEPDLFLLDCNMPGLSGFDLVPIIRAFRRHEETAIVFLTTEGTIDNITVAANLGGADFIVKPIDEAILREKMAQHTADFMIKRRIWRFAAEE